jgi:nucleoside-diphosphate-sugar epimerase
MKSFVSGAAGFIGSNLTDRLLTNGDEVIGWDNLSAGQRRFLENASSGSRFQLLEGDNLDRPGLTAAMSGCDRVFHLAANADVRFGLEHPADDLEQNTIATFNVLEAMRANSITKYDGVIRFRILKRLTHGTARRLSALVHFPFIIRLADLAYGTSAMPCAVKPRNGID